jgi:hypothetical protein
LLFLAHLGNSFGISPFVFYLVNSLLNQRNKAYTTTLALIAKKMNISKILYWNSLRTHLNKWLIIFSGITLLINLILPKVKIFKNSLIPFEFSNIIISAFSSLLIYIALVNFILIILELIDRMLNLRERKTIKKIFKSIAFLIFLFFSFLKMILPFIMKFYE